MRTRQVTNHRVYFDELRRVVMADTGPFLGIAIYLVRHKLDLTQEQMAAKTGIRRTTLGEWERGDHAPSGKLLAQFCESTGYTATDLADMVREQVRE